MFQAFDPVGNRISNGADKSNLHQVILDFPKQFLIGLEAGKKIPSLPFKPQFSNIIISGMGVSALSGDLLGLLAFDLELSLPIIVHRDYGLPKEASKKSFIVCPSYSGNTEETLSAFKEALKRKLKVVAIASGGKLIEFAKKNKIPFAKVPSGIQPRLALGYQFSCLLGILRKYKLLPPKVENKILSLERILKPKALENKGKDLAKKLLGKIPLVYSSRKNLALARIWKIRFNENSRVPSFFNVFPELNHNEMTGIGEGKDRALRKKFFLILLQDKSDHPRVKRRMEILSSIFSERGIKNLIIYMKEKDIFEKIFSSLLLSDWVSFYLAIFSGQDPTPLQLVEKFKKMLNE